MLDARKNLVDTVTKVIAALKATNLRDHREPGRKEKEIADERLARIFRRIFKRQAERVRQQLEAQHPDRKAISPPPDIDLNPDDEDLAELIDELIRATRGGISLFGQSAGVDIDYTLTNAEAAQKARQYAYDLVKDINQTTVETLQQAISAFVETPGMTIKDVMNLLPFDEQRAQRVAVTEITRAYAIGNQMAGEALKDEFPDVPIIKQWFTNNDDRVCPICAPLDGKEVAIDADFDADIFNPPAHPNCRCWTETSTKLAEL